MTRKTRPSVCPCPTSCTPIYNGLAFDDRIKTGDLMEGFSGDCIGKGDKQEYIVGGQVHTNDMNHCIITPLKGIIKFNICEGDVEAMLQMSQNVLFELRPHFECEKCGVSGRHVHFIVTHSGRLCCKCHYSQGDT